jgi:hypothetical protein
MVAISMTFELPLTHRCAVPPLPRERAVFTWFLALSPGERVARCWRFHQPERAG